MVNLSELLRTSPQDLASLQYDALRTYVIQRLEKVTQLIRDEQLDQAIEMCFYSPSGDGYGRDDRCLSFDEAFPDDHNGIGLGDVLAKLEQLKKIT